jgi:superfamily II DNA/RNA helicase
MTDFVLDLHSSPAMDDAPSRSPLDDLARTLGFAPAAASETARSEPAAPVAPPAKPVDGFEAFGLGAPLLAAVRDLGFTTPTPVQAKTIPLAMAPAAEGSAFVDLMVSSRTGSGKTAAFLLPVLQTLLVEREQREAQARAEREAASGDTAAKARGHAKKPFRRPPTHPAQVAPATPGALILCPTRELAQQVARDAIDLVRHVRGLRIATVIGGLPYGQQILRLHDASVVVATPGRLLDLQRSGRIRCEAVRFLVVDEADRMLDLGFADDLEEINRLSAERRQTMMFSATFEPRIQALARRVMREPQRVTIDTPQERHVNIRQALLWADNPHHKRALLDHLMRDTSIEQAIVFASTQIECDGLAADLADAGFDAVALHGAMSQGLRNRHLGLLRNGHIRFLVATDVAARGIDVPSISHVFNYGLPMKAEDYVHRIGRTGRAGSDGVALTIAEHRDRRKIGAIEHYTRQPLRTEVIPGLEPKLVKRDVPSRGAPGRGAPGRGAPGRGATRGKSHDGRQAGPFDRAADRPGFGDRGRRAPGRFDR